MPYAPPTTPRDPALTESFLRSEDGQSLVEYAIIIAVVAIAVLVAMIFFRGQISNVFSAIGNKAQNPCQGLNQVGGCP